MPVGGRNSDVQDYLQAGLLKAVPEAGESIGEFAQFAVVEFRENEFVQGLLLGGQTCQKLGRLVGQGHLDNSAVLGRVFSADEAFLFKQFRLSRDERRINLQLFRNHIDWHAIVLIDFRQGHQDRPLRTADTEGFAPEVAKFFEVHAYRSDHPGESPDNVLIFARSAAQTPA